MKFKRIYIEITNICNLSFSFCGNNKRKKEQMSLQNFEHIIKEIKDKTSIILLHVTGEPLLHEQLDDILYLCDKNHLKVHLTTNGTLLDKKIEILKRHECIEKIAVSLHCEQSKEDYFEKVFSSVDKLSTDIVVIYRIWALINGKLDKKSTKIVEKIKNHYQLSTDIVDKIYQEKNTKIFMNRYVDKASLFQWPKWTKTKSDGFCQGLKSQLAILVDGTVIPCCLDSEGKIKLGNIFEQSLDSILENEKSRQVRNGFKDNKAVESLCQTCEYKQRFKKF